MHFQQQQQQHYHTPLRHGSDPAQHITNNSEEHINNYGNNTVDTPQQLRHTSAMTVINSSQAATNNNYSDNNNNTSPVRGTTSTAETIPDELIPRTTFRLKVGLIGDAQVGKTSLMVKYVQSVFDEEYIQTLGVHHLEKRESLKYADILFVINDLGGQREFINMLPIVSEDAVAIVYLFDLTRPETLTSIKEWYRQAKGLNSKAIPLLIGTKYDLFIDMDPSYQEKMSRIGMLYAEAMNAPLIFSSTAESINVKIIFKIVVAKAFNLKLTVPEIKDLGDPILIYKNLGEKKKKN
ncbi:related to Protein TEM1 [Saccharomycodes ludwigii]|uniref:Related to Protein TEM1 n=1 Tax=Saccharomycodes ludwigii TaxID=36035 RepID=A0A376B4Y1_9ASCO|nr:hypothetical protein SCDLUD_004328 [Saccharomycodes ludwigii]KAH3900011.1 hypothetical protein SCDLUD_004328 [Saccharomycodes ludwigii]SSD59701.1 related to Protein TEM1 [Saccharomycodes ludwigii]